MTQFQCVGVDVAKDKFDVALNLNNRWMHKIFASNKKGYQAFLKWLTKNTEAPWVAWKQLVITVRSLLIS